MSDVVPESLTFSYGSVQIDGAAVQFAYNSTSRQLSVSLGEIAPGQTKTITFAATVNANAYGQSFTNTAVLSADNDSDKTASDNGVVINNGLASMTATKSVDKPTANVGDTLTYTITASNSMFASVCLDNDEAGRLAAERIAKILTEHGLRVSVLTPELKDWNADLVNQNSISQEVTTG